MTHPQAPWQFQGLPGRSKSVQWPNSRKSPPFPKIAGIFLLLIQFSQWLFKTPWTAEHQPSLSITLSYEIQFSSVTQLCPTLCDAWTTAPQASLSITNSWNLLKLMSIEFLMPTAISSSVVPFSSHLQSFPLSETFPTSQFLASGGQSIGASASASVLPMNIQDWFPLGWTGWISLQSKGLSRVFSNITVQKHQFFGSQLSLRSNTHIHTWLLEKP